MSDHLAIMERTGRILEQVISGEKTIESRWTMRRIVPYENIAPGETVYFKNSGSNAINNVVARATVGGVLFYEVNQAKIKELLRQYGKRLCMTNADDFEEIKGKRYCSLIFLKDVERLKRPFTIDKAGHGGTGSAWITLPDIRALRRG